MSLPDRLASVITTRSKTVLVTLLLLTVLIGSGMTMVDDDSSLGQFESESPETDAASYIDENFATDADENETTVQLIVRGENVLAQESILESLRYQQEIRDTSEISDTLVADDPITGVENILAITHIQQERAAQLETQTAQLEGALNETRTLEQSYAELNASYDAGEVSDEEYEQQAGEIEAGFADVQSEAIADLDDEQAGIFLDAFEQVRTIEGELIDLERQFEAGEIDEETYQRQQESLGESLDAAYEQGTVGVYADEYEALEDGETPTLDEQIEAIETMDEATYEELVASTLSAENADVLAMLPSGYDPGSTEAETRMTVLTQTTEDSEVDDMGGVFGPVVDGQLALQDLGADQDQEYMVFGFGIMSDEIDQSMADSLAIVGPLALLFVVVALMIAYRDVLDIVLGVFGILAVLVWTFGFMGWAGIAFNQMFVAVPVLLIGLSIDYAIHVFMRHREQRESGDEATNSAVDERTTSVDGAMKIALAGVGVALVWVTATAAIGFLANLVSPIQPIREFGLVSAFGIVAALIVFGGIVPAAKVELDRLLESRGYDRRKRAFGTGGGRFSRVLETGAIAAQKAPFVLVVVVLLVTAGGVYGAANVDTSFDEEDFLADDPPSWTEYLPGSLSPGEYQMKSNLDFVNEHYTRDDARAEYLINGSVTDDEILEEMAIAESQLDDRTDTIVYELPSGEADVSSPLGLMQRVADEESDSYNESFAATFEAADTTGNNVPDQDLESVYDELLAVSPEAEGLIYQNEAGEYEALRMVVAVQGDADLGDVTDELRAIGADFEAAGGGAWTVTATGDPIIFYIIEQDLFETVLESLLITLVVVFAFLSIAYRLTGNSASLGAVTLLPVALATSWILGTMYLIGMPFNVLTGMITSLTIGLGVAYCIHISSRYTLELDRQGNVWDAMETTVRGTGGALLGSAATTVGGFGTLSLAILPVLQQFGIITGLTIIYAFLASVIVLPSLLILWTRYFGPTDVSFTRAEPTDGKRGSDVAASDTDQARGDDD
ncbi:MMPL family transporter [Halovivax gelatinilyticus]|uniref:MMPL family transporter n=1 Tax=Halovivax gelatinilyticus TaxID=2961597 RepID=UPI0020CA5963|nr:MMPL family transporter [Halovivax gelatinilyticus]